MASLLCTNFHYRVQWMLNGKRPVFRIGKISKRTAQTVASHIEALVDFRAKGHAIPPATTAWVAELTEHYHTRLVKLGLLDPRERINGIGLEAYFKTYIARRTDLKSRSKTNIEQCQKQLVKEFGEARLIGTITRGEAMDWRRKMVKTLAEATIAGHVKVARKVFADAVDRRIIDENPFTKVKAGSQSNEERQRYIPTQDIETVIQACPDAEWRLVFWLARWGGIRVPSEIHALRWDGVDFLHRKIVVESPKTAHIKDGERRVIPMFPELFTPMLEMQEIAGESAGEFVFARLRATGNIATTAARIVRRAGLTPWPKLFNNLRASRETDLAMKFPLPLVCKWIGNSAAIARKHYLQVPPEEFDRAVGVANSAALDQLNPVKSNLVNAKTPNKSGVLLETYTPKGLRTPRRFPERYYRKSTKHCKNNCTVRRRGLIGMIGSLSLP